jgi:translation elongation factor P/translation initiation factor 5A
MIPLSRPRGLWEAAVLVKLRSTLVKVIASTLRKGNVVEKDGKLYVILTAENIHPGKGTPVTQLDMRRITDGVKISERYRTTEQVERAFVEDRDHTFLYQDGEGFHFMNPENYEQIAVPEDVVGDAAPCRSPSSCPSASPSRSSRPSRSPRVRRRRHPTSRRSCRTA